MNKFFTLILVSFVAFSLSAQRVARDKVVVEIGTGTWCPYCPGSAMGADDLVANGHEVAIIEYHSGDSYQNTYSSSRVAYYSITGFPTARFDGLNPYVGGSSSQSLYTTYLPRVNQRLAATSAFTIDVTGSHSGLVDFDLQIDVEKVASYTGGSLKVHAVITESHIEESWQGMDELNFVCRKMIPNQYGTAVDFTSGSTQQVNLSFTFDNEWVAENCELVVFLQDDNGKEILQATKMDLLEMPSANDYDANSMHVSNVPATTCNDNIEPSVMVRNLGNIPLTSVDIKYSINEGEEMTYQWTGTLDYLESEEISLPEIIFSPQEENDLLIYTENPNNNTDQYPDNDNAEQIIGEAEITPESVSLIMLTDANPEETTWELTNSEGEVLYSGGPYSTAGQQVLETFDLPGPDCYAFTVFDSGGDGLTGSGMYIVYYGSSNVFIEGSPFFNEQSNEFYADNAVGINETISSEDIKIYPNPTSGRSYVNLELKSESDVSVEVFSITGERVHKIEKGVLNAGIHKIEIDMAGMAPGIYMFRTLAGNQVHTEKVTVR
jgi:hypothetical protein